jgi:hypothetical protein
MFGNSDRKAVIAIAQWYRANSRDQAAQLQDAKPAPAFLLNTSSYYVFFVTARAGELILIIDDNDPGSIPTEQRLGPISEHPQTVFQRIIDTTKWFAEKQLEAGNIERGTWYMSNVEHIGSMLGLKEVQLRAMIALFEVAAKQSRVDPAAEVHRLGIMGQKFKQLGVLSLAADARAVAAEATDNANKRGDERYDLSAVRSAYELALEYVPAGQEAEHQWIAAARARVASLGG